MQDNGNNGNGRTRVSGGSPAPTTVIGVNARINGDILLDGDASILGKVDGRLEVGGELHVGGDAQVVAQVFCERLNLEGAIRGDVVAAKGVELGTNASLIGDIAAGCLMIPQGATCQGSFSIGPDAAQTARGQATAGRGATTKGTGGTTTGTTTNGQPRVTTETKPLSTATTAAAAS